MEWNYLFGRPVQPTRPRADGPRELFILGAYPSALHVRWESDALPRPILAVAVDNEPEPFWTGEDEQKRIAQWRDAVSFRELWGRVSGCGDLNGSSGQWVGKRVLKPLGITREQAWITDCLDTYFESGGAARRMKQPAVQEAIAMLGIRPRRLRAHPAESDIVHEALAVHAERLRAELCTARPELVVTLGNAALRVLAALAESSVPRLHRLSPDPKMYGRMEQVRIAGRLIAWLPLAHPAARNAYQQAHAAWILAWQKK